MAPHSSTLAWKIPWMEEPGRLQSMGSLRVGHDWATSLSLFTFMPWRRKRQPTPVFLPGESQGRGSLVAAVYRVPRSWTWLTGLRAAAATAQSRKELLNSPSQVSTECEPWVSRCSSWIYKGQGNPRLNCQHLLGPPKSKRTPGKHLLLFAYAKDFDWHNKITREKSHQNVNYSSKHGNTCLPRNRTSM